MGKNIFARCFSFKSLVGASLLVAFGFSNLLPVYGQSSAGADNTSKKELKAPSEPRVGGEDKYLRSRLQIDQFIHGKFPIDYGASHYPYFSNPNGCGPDTMSASRWGQVLIKTLNEVRFPAQNGRPAETVSFKKDCDAHDLCYMEVNQPDSGKESHRLKCDQQLGKAIEDRCDQLAAEVRQQCLKVKDLYVSTVGEMGAVAYKVSQTAQNAYLKTIKENWSEIQLMRSNQQVAENSSTRQAADGAEVSSSQPMHLDPHGSPKVVNSGGHGGGRGVR